MDEVRSKGLIAFYKDCCDVGRVANVFCDFSILEWMVLRPSVQVGVRLCALLEVDQVSMVTSSCIIQQLDKRFPNKATWGLSRDQRVCNIEKMFDVLFHYQLHTGDHCSVNVLKDQMVLPDGRSSFPTSPFFFASCHPGVYQHIQKVESVPVITLVGEKFVITPPLENQKARLKRLQRRKLLRLELEREMDEQEHDGPAVDGPSEDRPSEDGPAQYQPTKDGLLEHKKRKRMKSAILPFKALTILCGAKKMRKG